MPSSCAGSEIEVRAVELGVIECCSSEVKCATVKLQRIATFHQRAATARRPVSRMTWRAQQWWEDCHDQKDSGGPSRHHHHHHHHHGACIE